MSNLGCILALAFTMLMIFSPSTKALVLTGLMKIGLFQPSVKEIPEAEKASNPLPGGISFYDTAGNLINLSEQKGKVLFINFWAVWCPPCIAEMPSINTLYNKFKDDRNVVFLMVDVDGKPEKSLKFMQKRGFSLPVHVPASAIPENIFSGSIPTTLIVDKKGNIVFHHSGGADYSNPKLIKYLEELSKK